MTVPEAASSGRELAHVRLSVPVEFTAWWAAHIDRVVLGGSYGFFPAFGVHLTTDQAGTLASQLITAVLDADPGVLPGDVLAAMSAGLEYHWRDTFLAAS